MNGFKIFIICLVVLTIISIGISIHGCNLLLKEIDNTGLKGIVNELWYGDENKKD